jgi:hypothetical protein
VGLSFPVCNAFTFGFTISGDVRRLHGCIAPKILLLKECAKVILIKNIGDGLFNGMTGIVHHLEKGSAPVINFNGNIVKVTETAFDIYDTRQQKNLASRTQVPLIRLFIVLKDKHYTMLKLSAIHFFAPGQMGVAIGRAVSLSGLRVMNFNCTAASTKHPDVVYEFYEQDFADFTDDLLYCKQKSALSQSSRTCATA